MANKRGRKRKNDMYFGPNEEEAVINFLESEDETERNLIFNEWLKGPLDKMIESIIRRYKLYRKGETFEELHSDTVSFLMTKVHKFEQGRGKKAYSYFGTISKNYILGLLIKDEKYLKQTSSYEDISSNLEERADLAYYMDDYQIDYRDIIIKLTIELENFVDTEELTDNERKLGYALLEIFSNFDKIFQVGDGNKFNKNLILLSLREMTSLSTKEIRISLKRYKNLYDGILGGFLE